MPADPRCAAVEPALIEALLARRAPDAAERGHLESCAACAAAWRRLAALAADLAAAPPREPSPELVARTLASARLALAAPPAAAAAPSSFRRELLRLLGGALLPLPLVVAWNALVLGLGAELLAPFVPVAVLWLLGAAYGVAAAGWLGVLYGSLPLLAESGVRRRLVETP
jgi:predicted anti-sigma-YlaC factor YlaD